MPLERFIPKSPDPFIRNSQDFEVAKFGHLNTIIEYINTYVAADSLQLAGAGPLTSTARYITDSLGNTSTLAISTVNIGVGTTTPIVPLNIYNSSASVSSVVLVEQDTAAVIGQINQYRKNGSVNLTNGTEIGRISFGGYFNSTYSPFSQVCSAIYGYYGGTGTDRVGGLRLITWNGGGSSTRLQVAPDGKIGIGTVSTTAKLQIVGEGSTSATTSLLVQNSAATQILKVQDDGQVFVNQGNQQITFAGAGGISRIQAPNEMTIGLGASFNAMKVYYDGRVGLQNDAVFINSGNVGIGTTAPAAKLTIDTGDLLFTTPGNSQIYGLRNGVNQDTRIIINNQSTGGLHLGAKYGNPSGCIYFECGLGAYTERMRLTPNGNLLIGTTSDTARLNIVGSGSTFATISLLVQNSGGSQILSVLDDGTCSFGRSGGTTYCANFYTNQGLIARIGNNEFACPSAFYRQGSGLVTFYGTNNNSIAWNFDHNNSQQTTSTGVSMINIGGTYSTQHGAQFSSLSIQPTYDLNANTTTSSIARGIYYNPTITNLRVAQHYAWHNTSGAMIVNSSTPQSSAILQADSTTQGFLPPRMTTAQRTAIVSPAAGLIVYDTDTNKSYTYDGTAWQAHW